MKRIWWKFRLELQLLWNWNWLLLLVALALLGLTHGVLEFAYNWRKHYIENMESFFPIAMAIITTPVFLVDHEDNVLEHEATSPMRAISHWRLAVLWTTMWFVVMVVGLGFDAIWGPVDFWAGAYATLGPAVFLSGLAIWTTLLTNRLAVGYLTVLSLAAADLILRILGAFQALWGLQLLDLFAFRWNITTLPWPWVKTFMLITGVLLIEGAILLRPRLLARGL
ncbi:MAG: hypothetical protein C7B46_11285 [Sulfobacillus benefaciens]|uniref:Uncharacterized protein n=1 Tax=Sulfobacillus benefaciens TaxID=453960 RepID=A0A2T2XF72_9FIRM|nr:MAG: hypothetical protein C7B46_11285 [Sulfobacillus benefaciens]